MRKDRYGFNDLLEIMQKLRSPGGCPWDREQTHVSLKRYMVEEAYEALEAIDSGNDAKISEELGDVLLQVVFHSQIAMEENRFDAGDVVDGICRKLIERHTHVFGDVIAKTPDEVLKNWDKIKNKAKGLESHTERIFDIPKNYPALLRSLKIQEKAAKAGFDWDSVDGAVQKTLEEIGEVVKARDGGDRQEIEAEIGDLLFSLVNVSRFLKVEPETALQSTADRFVRRFEFVENECRKRGMEMERMSLAELDLFWDKAKEGGV
ncbi:MAG: nucleoside triphosphate pyrophosphohydrolase [Clostridia bacterium]